MSVCLPSWRTAMAAASSRADVEMPRATDPDLHALALRALDAATSAGASYADVRFTMTRDRTFTDGGHIDDAVSAAVGVRVLAQGTWGFMTASEWTAERMAQLGRQAVAQATAHVWPGVPPRGLGERPPAATGHWETPMVRDPFTVSRAEWYHLNMIALNRMMVGQQVSSIETTLNFRRQERVFASTDGAYVTQTINTAFNGESHLRLPLSSKLGHIAEAPGISPRGGGYEVVEALDLWNQFPHWIDVAKQLEHAKPFEQLGEYDVVFDGAAMSSLVAGSFGLALEYDRAVGNEADAGGTSYLAPPAKVLGTPVAAPTLTITADRTLAGGAATVGWDDDGVAPRPVPLIQDGVLVDYAASREFVPELAAWYRQRGRPVRSNGCAAAESARTMPLVFMPNLLVQPGPDTNTLATLVSGVDRGYAIFGGGVAMDFQSLTGKGHGARVYAIRHGKLAELVSNVAYTFKSQEIWKRLDALGGASTAIASGKRVEKGEPAQEMPNTVQAVAARFRNVRLQNAQQV